MFSSFKRYWKYLENKTGFLFIVLIAIPITVLKSYQAFHVKNVIDSGFIASSGINDVIYQSGILVLLQLVQTPLRIFYYNSIRVLSESASLKIREKILNRVQVTPMSEFEKEDQGESLTLSVSDTRIFSEGFQQLAIFLKEPLTCVGYLCVAFIQDWQLATLIIFIVPCFILVLRFITKKIKKYSKIAQDFYGNLSLKVKESLEGNLEIKSYNLGGSFQKSFEAVNRNYTDAQVRAISYEEHSSPLIELIGSILISGVLIFAHQRFSDNSLTIGEFISFFTALGLFMTPLKKINNANKLISRGLASLDRIESFLSLKEVKLNPGTCAPDKNIEKIEFKKVSFQYDDKKVLDEISFVINKGEKVAFVGKSGSGKSTIASLLLGLYKIKSGQYLINNCDVLSSDVSEIYEYIPQSSYFFEGGFYENIFFNSGVIENIQKHSRALNLKFLEGLDLDQLSLKHTSSFSGGEKQRIALLRALYSNRDVFLMDEATSALDSENEKLVSSNFYSLKQDKTFICIAHRLETIRNFDKIFLLKNGRIIENGKHEDLIALDGEYAKLYQAGLSL